MQGGALRNSQYLRGLPTDTCCPGQRQGYSHHPQGPQPEVLVVLTHRHVRNASGVLSLELWDGPIPRALEYPSILPRCRFLLHILILLVVLPLRKADEPDQHIL